MTLFTSSLLFSTLLGDSHLCPPRLNSSQLVSTRLTSCHLFNSSHLFSPPLNSPHLFLSSYQLFSPSQLWPTLLNSAHLLSQRCLRTVQTRRSIYTQQALTLHREAPRRRSFYTQQVFTHSKLLQCDSRLSAATQ